MRVPFLAALLVVTTLALSGCDTMQSDFNSFIDTFNPPTPAQAATWAVDTNDAENQRRGIALLAGAPWGGAEPYQKLYRLYLEENTDPLVKAFAIRALGRHGDAADAVLVAKQLTSTYRIVRLEAAKSLQRLHDPQVADAIWKQLLLQNPEEEADIRTELAIALGQYPTDAVFNALVSALDQRELAVNWAALDSLQSLTGQDFQLDQAKWLSWRASTKTPFRNEECFLYPTYQRDKNWLDYLLFWVPLTFEEPGLPQGTKITGPRRTYQGEEPASDFKLPEKDAPEPPEKPAPAKTPVSTPTPTGDGSK